MSKSNEPITLEPWGPHNQELVEQVHPPDWKNPRPKERYNLVVIGGGTAGLVSAIGGAGLGAKVALIEKHLLGGDCLNYGCVPSKAVLRAARAWKNARNGGDMGAPEAEGDGDFGAAMERMRRLRARIGHHDSAHRLKKLGVDVYLGTARFVASDAVEVEGQRLEFRRAVIATGGQPLIPPIEGVKETGVLTNETIFNLTTLPESLLIVGGGPIGCELAQAFARFGSRVTVVDMSETILSKEDDDAAKIVHQALEKDGVTFELGAKVVRLEATDGGKAVTLERDGKETRLEGEEVLMAVGRAANVEGLGLPAAGVDFDKKGITVDDRLQTSNSAIFAAGDVASRYQFTHTADAQARIVLRNALFPLGRRKNSDLVIPWCTYTSPEIAHTGLYEKDAREEGYEVETLTIPLEDNDRALVDGETEGFLRLHLKKGSDEILGATLVAEHAGDMITEATLAITHGLGLGDLGSTIHPYPTQSELFKKAADTYNRGRLTPKVKGWLKRYFRWLR